MKLFWEKEKKITPIRGVLFSPDGSYIFCNDFKLVFIDNAFEKEICEIPCHNKDTCKNNFFKLDFIWSNQKRIYLSRNIKTMMFWWDSPTSMAVIDTITKTVQSRLENLIQDPCKFLS